MTGRRAWPKLVALGFLASFTAASLSGEVGAKPPPKKGAVTARYTLTVEFKGLLMYEAKNAAGETQMAMKGEADTVWVGTSKPFILVNRGSPSKPKISIRSVSEVNPYSVTIAGFLDHKGKGSGTVSGPEITCTWPITESAGDASALARVTILSNILRIQMIPEGTAGVAYGPDSCTGETTVKSCDTCLAFPETLGFSSDWWSQYPSIDASAVKFGRAFTLGKRSTGPADPQLRLVEPFRTYHFEWVLRFKPVRR